MRKPVALTLSLDSLSTLSLDTLSTLSRHYLDTLAHRLDTLSLDTLRVEGLPEAGMKVKGSSAVVPVKSVMEAFHKQCDVNYIQVLEKVDFP